MNSTTIKVLLVEDDPADIELTQKAFQRADVGIPLNVVTDGEEAIAYLRQQGKYTQVLQPDLILLDLNLPGLSGREVLTEIKTDKHLKHIPVVILTTSASDEEILKSYNLGANAYLTKPVGLKGFLNIVKSLDCFWFTLAKLPPHV
jgi:two-component system, chemotaxis family, response regulator Rcp1